MLHKQLSSAVLALDYVTEVLDNGASSHQAHICRSGSSIFRSLQDRYLQSLPVDTCSMCVAGPSYLMVHSVGYDSQAVGEAKIKVIGVGGGGGNALNCMIDSNLQVSLSMTALILTTQNITT